MGKQYKKLSALIPAYNEATRIEGTIAATESFLQSLGMPYEIIIVDDGSADDTYAVANRLASATVKVYRTPQNHGKGAALRTAFGYAEGDLILFLDADLDIHPDQCAPLLDVLQRENVQVTIGSKLHPDATIKYPLKRRILSRGYSLLVQTLFDLPLRDTQTGIKLFESDVLDKVFSLVQLNGFAFDLELMALANRNGFAIKEVPIEMQFGDKRNHMSAKVVMRMFKDTVSLFWRLHRKP